MRESSLWNRFKDELEKARRLEQNMNYELLRIETGSTMRGFPDVLYLCDGTAIFIELKVCKGNTVDITPFQVNFHRILWNRNFQSYVLMYRKFNTDRLHDRFYLCEGRYAMGIRAEGIHATACREYDATDPDDVRRMLFEMGLISLRYIDKSKLFGYTELEDKEN